jgi:hypothetical protein
LVHDYHGVVAAPVRDTTGATAPNGSTGSGRRRSEQAMGSFSRPHNRGRRRRAECELRAAGPRTGSGTDVARRPHDDGRTRRSFLETRAGWHDGTYRRCRCSVGSPVS